MSSEQRQPGMVIEGVEHRPERFRDGYHCSTRSCRGEVWPCRAVVVELLRQTVRKKADKLTVATCPRCHGKGYLVQYGGPNADYDESSEVPCDKCRTSHEALGQRWVQTGRRGKWEKVRG